MLSVILTIENEQDRSFVAWLYETYEKKMYVEAMEILQNHHDAQDCIHETIRKIIEILPTFKDAEEKGSLGGLVSITCRNCALNMYKSRERERKHIYCSASYEDWDFSNLSNIADEDENIQKIIISEENYRYLQSLIDSLDDIYRDVILLKSMGMKYAEIAVLLGITEETARQRMARGRKLLLKKGGKQLYDI